MFNMTLKLFAHFFVLRGLTLLFMIAQQGLLIKTVAADNWRQLPTTAADCTVGTTLCCVSIKGDADKVGAYHELKAPQGAAITGRLSYGNPPRTLFDAAFKKVSVKHYDPSKDSTIDYFVMHRERLGEYYNHIDWHPGEIDKYGQYLAVCVI